MMNEYQIAARLLGAHNDYIEKMGAQPTTTMTCSISPEGKARCGFHGEGYSDFRSYSGKSAAEALDKLDAAIAAIPSEAERLRAEAAKAVGKAIEACRAAGYPDDFVNPLTEMSKRISENALTFEGAPV